MCVYINLLDIKGFWLKFDAFMGIMLNMRPMKPIIASLINYCYKLLKNKS